MTFPILTLRAEPLEPRDTPASLYAAAGADIGNLPLVQVARPDGSVIARFDAFESTFRGGVRAAAAELDGNPNTVEVVATPGPGGGSNVKVFSVDVASGGVAEIASFFAFESAYRGGLFVTAGDVANRGTDQIVVGADQGGGPRVRTFALDAGTPTPVDTPLGDFFAFESTFRGGVRVAAGELDNNPGNGDELVVGAGVGGGPRVRVFRADGSVALDYFAAGTGTNGVFVGFDPSAAVGLPGAFRIDGGPADFSQRNADLNSAATPPAPVFVAPVLSTIGNPGGFPVFAGTPGTNFGPSFGSPTFPSQIGGATNIGGVPNTNIGGVPNTNVGGTTTFNNANLGTPGFGGVGTPTPTNVTGTTTTNPGF